MIKPPYRVPTMDEIRAIPWNGLKVASTFSGAGGSCTGYRMAGYRVVWANEFVPAAQDSYRANMASGSILDPRDIRKVQAQDILDATGLKAGELDLFDGSPPCQAFSTAGKREKGWGKERHYEHGASQKNEELFFEYIRLLGGLKPRAFVAENVSGLVKGTAKGFFLEILAGLKAQGYRVTCRVLDAQWLGVPQSRQRAIFVGVRDDLDRDPVHPSPLGYRYSVRDALPELLRVATRNDVYTDASTAVSPAVLASDGRRSTSTQKGAALGMGEFKVIQDESGERSAGDVTDQPAPTGRSARAGTMFIQSGARPAVWTDGGSGSAPAIMAGRVSGIQEGATRRKFTIAEVKRICAFPDDFILTGSYAQQWERLGNSVPPVMMRAIAEAIRDKVLQP